MVGRIVCSKSGRDKGYFMVVTEIQGNYLLVCDGKERPLERPKKKNPKHLSFTGRVLLADDYQSNKSLRKALAVYKNAVKEEK